jgi:hypothetical protein
VIQRTASFVIALVIGGAVAAQESPRQPGTAMQMMDNMVDIMGAWYARQYPEKVREFAGPPDSRARNPVAPPSVRGGAYPQTPGIPEPTPATEESRMWTWPATAANEGMRGLPEMPGTAVMAPMMQGFHQAMPPQTPYLGGQQRPLTGIWQGRRGEILAIQKSDFQLYAGPGRYSRGTFRIVGDLLYWYTPATASTIPFQFAVERDHFWMRDAEGQVYVFRRLD